MKQLIYLYIIGLYINGNLWAGNDYQSAPDFKLQGETDTVKLTDYKGKVVLLDFWASWCEPCRLSFPWMNEIQKRYEPMGFEVIAINLDKDRTLVEDFLSKTAVAFTLAFDPEGEVASRYDLKGMPSSFLIDKHGRILLSHVGFFHSEQDKREREIKKALNLL
jgi:thiol-disulfide isomerase/thioredoxin